MRSEFKHKPSFDIENIDPVYAHNDPGAHGDYLAATFEYATGGKEAI